MSDMSAGHGTASPKTASPTTASPTVGPLTTADGKPLKTALANAQKKARRRALLLVLPLLAFVLLTFVLPIGQLLLRSIHNADFVEVTDIESQVTTPIMQNVSAWFDTHPIGTEPDEAAYAALVADLGTLKTLKAQGLAGARVNYDYSGSRSMFTAGARDAAKLAAPFKDAVIAKNPKWADPMLWRAMRSAAHATTIDFYLAALDRTRDVNGRIVQVPENEAVYVHLFWRTFLLSAIITVTCLILAFPVAHLLATLPMARANLLMILVLLPFWTSLLVRTTAWMVLLQSEGVINNILVSLGIISDANRIQMINNQTGTIIAMTHILLPFMILPLYSVMRTIPPSYVRAARSLGATSWTAFRRIYLPQTLPGMGAGGLLVFILAVGYYITPALLGGASGQLISNLIAFHMNKTQNWSMAAALASLLLFAVLALYWLYDRLVGIDKLKLG